MNTKLDVFFSALTAFCVVAGGSIVTVISSQAGGTAALNKTAWILSCALGLVAAAKDVRSLLKLPPVSLAAKAKVVVPLLALAFLIGCASAVATKSSTGTNGVVTAESITVKSFLSTINNGSYSNGSGMTLSVSSATPDQQSIAILSGAVTDLGKSAMLLAKSPTNTVSVATNATGNIIVTPAKP